MFLFHSIIILFFSSLFSPLSWGFTQPPVSATDPTAWMTGTRRISELVYKAVGRNEVVKEGWRRSPSSVVVRIRRCSRDRSTKGDWISSSETGSAQGANAEFGRFFLSFFTTTRIPLLEVTQFGCARGEAVAGRIIPSLRFSFLSAALKLQPDQPRDSGKNLYPKAYHLAGNRTLHCRRSLSGADVRGWTSSCLASHLIFFGHLIICSPVIQRSVVTWRNVGWEAFRFLRSIRKWLASASRMCTHREAACCYEDLRSIGGRY